MSGAVVNGVIGYCSGGRQSFLVGLRLPVNAVIDCYGAFVAVDPPSEYGLKMTSLIGEVDQLQAPLLGLFGAEDKNPTPEQNQLLADALTAAGKEFTFRTFDDAGHAFFMVDRVSFRPEAAIEGWKDIFTFLERTLA